MQFIKRIDVRRGRAGKAATLGVSAAIAVICLMSTLRAWSALEVNDGASTTETPGALVTLLAFQPERMVRIDTARMNLLCAEGLPGAPELDLQRCLTRLDDWANRVRQETERHQYRFKRNPAEFEHSEAYFRMLCLVTVLHQDLGVGYSPNRAKPSEGAIEPNEVFFADSRDIFLHGLLGLNRTGTCASLPVLYIAVGRRLGYALKLVAAKNHLFVRWESERERLNIEATTQGLTTFDDDYYRRWPFPMTPEEERTERYLTSLSPADELSVFLSLRTQCLLVAGRFKEALSCQEQVCRLAPHSPIQREILEQVKRRAQQQTQSKRNNQTAQNL